MGRNGHGPKRLWTEMFMGRNDYEPKRPGTVNDCQFGVSPVNNSDSDSVAFDRLESQYMKKERKTEKKEGKCNRMHINQLIYPGPRWFGPR